MARRVSRAWIALGSIVALAVVLVVALPYIVRTELVKTLHSEGLTSVHIKNINVDILTGHIAIEQAMAKNPAGRGFYVGRLSVDVAYLPLIHHRIVLESLSIRGARIDVTRTAKNGLRIAGISLTGNKQKSHPKSQWHYGLEQLTLGALAIRYHQPANGKQPAITQVVTLNRSSASNLVTWKTGEAMPLNAKIGVNGGSIEISGQVVPFGQTRRANLHVVAHGFPLSIVSPLARRAGVTQASGRIDMDEKINVTDSQGKPLHATTTGRVAFENIAVTRTGNVQAKAKQIAWNGQANIVMSRPNHAPGEIDTHGKFSISQLSMQQGSAFHLTAAAAHVTGKGETIFGHPLRISTHGSYDDQNVHLEAGGRLQISTAGEKLTGDIETTMGDDRTTVVGHGQYAANQLSVAIPQSLSFDSQQVAWQGTAETTVAAANTRIDMDGKISSAKLDAKVANTATFTASGLHWDGQSHVDDGDQLITQLQGHLIADSPALEIAGMPIAVKADNLIFDGSLGRQPQADGTPLQTNVGGSLSSRDLTITDTKINAPWLALLQARASDIKVAGLSDIGIGKLKTSGVSILGDTNTSSSVIQAVSLDAQNFKLEDMRHYSLDSLTMSGAIIHVRRTDRGMGVISQFLGSGKNRNNSKKKDQSSSTSADKNTYTIKKFSISGPAMYFTDTSMTPSVNLQAANLDFDVENLDTAKPSQQASYDLGLDIGAYGHFNSKGTIAPVAPKGMDMDVHAWLRSLALPPLSGYLNAAMGRKISRGVINGTVNLKSTNGQLNGQLSASIANFRLANDDHKTTEIALGINMSTALALIRGQDDEFHFQTKILGDVTNPYFSIDNLIREAILAGLRTALFSNYSPIGLAAKLKTVFLNFFREVAGHPATFVAGKHYIRPVDRDYLGQIAQAMVKHPNWQLSLQGEATLADAKAMDSSPGADANVADSQTQQQLEQLASLRVQAVRDYLAARGVNTADIQSLNPIISTDGKGEPDVRFTLKKKGDS